MKKHLKKYTGITTKMQTESKREQRSIYPSHAARKQNKIMK